MPIDFIFMYTWETVNILNVKKKVNLKFILRVHYYALL